MRTEIDPTLSAIEADLKSLKQILYNYTSNALKFTPEEGEVTIRVLGEDADYFRIEVEDTGIGITTEEMGRLFVEFQQLDSGTAKKYAGTGLGLALTKKIVEAQKGAVGVRSKPGKGSVFYAVLPRVCQRSNAIEQALKSAAIPAGASLILVVEDDARDRAWIAKTLVASGYAVEAVATGSEALMRCREKRFDAITLDIMLPDMSGRAVLARIRDRGLNQETPVIVVTLLAGKGIMAGFHVADILAKPVSANEILIALKRCGIEPDSARSVLVVDDDEAALKVAEATLTRLGYRAVCEQSAETALDAASKEHPAAVVLDLVMPEIDGFEFLKRFRTTRAGRQTPIIVWTGKDLTAEERSRLRSAAQSVVRKSEEADELVREIKNCLPLAKPAMSEV